MCGIFGVVASSPERLQIKHLDALTQKLFLQSQTRGKDASGVVCLMEDKVLVHKAPRMAAQLLRSEAFASMTAAASQSYIAGKAYVLAGHTRMVTNGSKDNQHNNQPVIKGDSVVLHNGIIVNDHAIWAARPELQREHQVDTEVFAAMVEHALASGVSWVEAIRSALSSCQGANTFAAIHARQDSMMLSTTNGSLHYFREPQLGLTVFGSEAYILRLAQGALRSAIGTDVSSIIQVKPNHLLSISLQNGEPTTFGASNNNSTQQQLSPGSMARRVIELEPEPSEIPTPLTFPRHSVAELEEHMRFDIERIRSLKRCTRCILPETFPFIRFDSRGICQFCLQHKPLALHTERDLLTLADQARSADGSSDCLVPISGGRDSCFGLHYVKKELGLNPVAYTYDWGFVTDLARRNTSRMCGELNVEHILVAADIRQKRENVRKNVSAWLHRPTLSMIPLFMAGDKAFFYYASQIKKQLALGPILFSMNWLEKTGFKTGFAGVNDTGDHEKTYGLSPMNQVRLLSHYGYNFLSNPRYLNRSIPDTVLGYLSYYLQDKNYHSLFDYMPWSQSTIEDTLIQQYDWETSPDSKSTWRIGDGTAPFYNYIYLTIAGFSEHDTFRSNQIREGMIAREEALREVEEENEPRVDSFKWYCDTIGIDALAAVKAINSAPRLYEASNQ